MRLALLSALLLCVACSSGKPPPPGGQGPGDPVDAGTNGGGDAGGDPDAGADAGTGSDAGPETDGGAGDDAGTGTDGGSGSDAGTEADAGTECVAPATVPGTTLAPGLNNPRRLAVDATDIYVSETHSLNPTKTEGRLLRLPRAGGSPATVAEGFKVPDAIAVDAAYVYVLDADGLWRVPKPTGPKGSLPLDDQLGTSNSVTVGGTDLLLTMLQGREVIVVATASRRLVRLDRDGQARQELFDGGGGTQVRGARVVGTDVWFLVSGGPKSGLYRVPLDGSTAAEQVDATITAGTSLEVTATDFLITEGSGGQGQVKRRPRAGGPAVVLADGLQGPMFPVELDGTVYFKDASAGSNAFLRRVRACGTRLSDPVGPVGTGPGALLEDGSTLLYTSQESGTGGAVGGVSP